MKSRFSRSALAIAVVAVEFMVADVNIASAQALEEVMVTARKREESLMDAPLALTAVKGAAMDAIGITNLEQLSPKVPGLQIGRAAQTSSIYIRGIGSGINKGFEQSVGMYVDGIYQVRSRQFTSSLVDLERVEVLRGPQSILFGKNTIAGAIKVETASPEIGDAFNGSVTTDYEPDQATARGTVVLSGGLTDTLAARLALRYQESDGYVENQLRGDEQLKEDSMARLSVVWAPSDSVDVTAKLSHTEMESEGKEMTNPLVDTSLLAGFQAGTNKLGLTDVMGTIAALSVPGYRASSGGDEYKSWVANAVYFPGGTDTEDTDSSQASVRVDWDLGDLNLTSLTGYSKFELEQDHDVDFHGGNAVHSEEGEDLELWSQELRLASDFDGRVNFVTGLYYEEQELSVPNYVPIDGTLGGVFGQLLASALNPALPAIPLSQLGINSLWNGQVLASLSPAYAPLIGAEQDTISRYQYNDFDNDTLAAFVELSFDLTGSLSLDLGGRYSEDSKKNHKRAAIGAGTPDARLVSQNPDGSYTGALDAKNSALVTSIWGPLLSTWVHDQQLESNEEHFDPSARLRWQLDDATMMYLSWSEGYKSGGFNTSPDSANPDGTPGEGTSFGDETASAWELGLKTTQWDGRARFSVALFQTTVDDLQVTSFKGTTFQVGNAAELASSGVEVETQLALTDNLEAGGSVAYLDSEFESFEDAPCTIYQVAAVGSSCAQDLSGERGPFAPEWSGNVYASYERPVGEQLLLRMRVDGMYKDDMFLNLNLDPNMVQEAYFKMNARLGIGAADDRWEVALYGRNLTDETTYTFMVDTPLSAGIQAGWIEEPRVLGLQGRYNF